MLVPPALPSGKGRGCASGPGFQQYLQTALREQRGLRGPWEMVALETLSSLETFAFLAFSHFEWFKFKAYKRYFIPFTFLLIIHNTFIDM